MEHPVLLWMHLLAFRRPVHMGKGKFRSYNACMEEFETACGWERRPDVAQKQCAPAQGPRKACAVSPFPSQKAALGAGRTFYMKTQGGHENGILSWH